MQHLVPVIKTVLITNFTSFYYYVLSINKLNKGKIVLS